jgi:N-acetylneuraminic acid mutarotase
MKLLAAGLVMFAATLSVCAAGGGNSGMEISWKESAVTPEPRAGYAAGSIDKKLVLIGGSYWEGVKGNWTRKQFTGATHVFDPFAERWQKIADAPVTLAYAGYTQTNNQIFVLGGLQNGKASAEVHILGKRGDEYQWQRGQAMPEPRLFAATAVVGSTIYVIGGTSEFEPFDAKGACCTSRSATNTVWKLDTGSTGQTWQWAKSYPGKARWAHRAISDGKTIYVFGGNYQAQAADPVTNFDEVLRYDPAANAWTRVADLPSDLRGAAPVLVRGRIVLIASGQKAMLFDPSTASFSPVEGIPQDAYVDHFAWIEPLIVGSGGENKIEGPRRRSEWTFIGRVK